MLTVKIPGEEFFDDELQEFVESEDLFIVLEHSLVSLSKWESKFEKPFLTSEQKTPEEIISYIEAMVLTPGVSLQTLNRLTQENVNDIMAYMDAKMTATWFNEINGGKKSREVITSELIYYWLIGFQIPFEPVDTWHLNRLLTLVRVCNAKNAKPKKMDPAEAAAHRAAINERNRARLGTRG